MKATAGTVAASATVDWTSDTSRQARKPFAGSAVPTECAAAARRECGSTTGQRSWPEAEGVSMGLLLKPLRFKRGITAGRGSRQTADSKQEDAERKCGRRVSAARFSTPQARGLCSSRRQDDRFKTATVRSQRFIPALNSLHAVMPSSSSLNTSRSIICTLFACSVPVSVSKHRDRDLKSICQRPHVIRVRLRSPRGSG